MIKKAPRPTQKDPQGGILEIEGTDPRVQRDAACARAAREPTRVGRKREDGARVRVLQEVRQATSTSSAQMRCPMRCARRRVGNPALRTRDWKGLKHVAPRLKEKYQGRGRPAAQGAARATRNVNEVPRLEKIVVNMGVGAAVQDSKQLDAAIEDLRDHHRPAADDHARQEVDRRLQDAPGHADRREGHAARRPDVGVLRPPALDGASRASATSAG